MESLREKLEANKTTSEPLELASGTNLSGEHKVEGEGVRDVVAGIGGLHAEALELSTQFLQCKSHSARDQSRMEGQRDLNRVVVGASGNSFQLVGVGLSNRGILEELLNLI